MLRTELNDALKTAMKAKEVRAVSTLRLILAALKDREIANRTQGADDAEVNDADILLLLQSMIKQRRDSIEAYTKGGREELAAKEAEEIVIIERFLPEQMGEEAIDEVVSGIIDETGAGSLKEMGQVMGLLRERFAGQMDFGKAGALVKQKLG